MNKHVLAAAFTATTLLTGNAVAAGAYVGVSVGQADVGDLTEAIDADLVDLRNYPVIVSSTSDDKDTAFKVFTGFAINDNLAVEIAYTDLGEASGDLISTNGANAEQQTENGEVTAIVLDIVGALPFSEQVSGFVKIGAAQTKVDWSYTFDDTNGNDGSDSKTVKKTGLHYGAGVGVDVASNINLFAEYEVYQVEGDFDTFKYDADIKAVNLGAKLKF